MKNIFQIVHIIGSMQGLYLFLQLIIRKENKLANKVLAALIFLITVNLGVSFLHTNNNEINDLIAIGRSDMFIFCYGPLITFYTLFLTEFRNKLQLRFLLHLSPSIIILILLILSYAYLDCSLLMPVWDEGNPAALRIWYVIHSMALIHLLTYLIYSLVIVYKYKKRLSSYFSQTGSIYLLWLRILLLSIIFICLVAILQFLLYSFKDPEGILNWIISVTIVLLVFAIGYFTSRQPDILEDLKKMNELLLNTESQQNCLFEAETSEKAEAQGKQAKYERNRLDEAEEKSNLDKLLKFIEENKPYLDSELNLRKLAEMVKIPSHQLSMLLSLYLELNFYTFINKYRVEEAKKRLSAIDSKKFNILTIAYETGFNSKSTFNSVFKKFEGVTPSEYRSLYIEKRLQQNF